jgi:creatine kinase
MSEQKIEEVTVTFTDPKDTVDFKYKLFTEKPTFTPQHRSLMSKILTPEIFDLLKDRVTSKGYTFSNVIQAGIDAPHLGVGATAGDEESWEVFKELMHPVIIGWHGFDPATQEHHTDLDPSKLVFSDEQRNLFNRYVASTRIRAARNVSGYALPCGTQPEERAEVERILTETFAAFEGDLKGRYYPLGSMTAEEEKELQENGFLFQKPSARNVLSVAGAGRHWPNNRGIFHNDSKTVLCWVNEEDHCRIISMENGGDVVSVFARFCALSNALAASAEHRGTKLMYDDHLGFLGTCPSNLGTGLRASVMMFLPQLARHQEFLDRVCDKFDLQARGSSGEHTEAIGGKYDVSNKQRIGLSEVQLVQKMIDGVTKVIFFEEQLTAGASIADLEAQFST